MDNSPQDATNKTDEPLSTFDIYSPRNFLRFNIFIYTVVAISLIVFLNVAPHYGLSANILPRSFLSPSPTPKHDNLAG